MGSVRADAQAFARDGVVCLRSVLDSDQVAAAAEAIDAVLARPGPLAQVASAADDPGAFTEDFCRWREIPQIEAVRPGTGRRHLLRLPDRAWSPGIPLPGPAADLVPAVPVGRCQARAAPLAHLTAV